MCHCVVSLTALCLVCHFSILPIFLSLVINAIKYYCGTLQLPGRPSRVGLSAAGWLDKQWEDEKHKKSPLHHRNHTKLTIILIFWIQIIELIASFESEIDKGSISLQGGNSQGKFKEVASHVSVNWCWRKYDFNPYSALLLTSTFQCIKLN